MRCTYCYPHFYRELHITVPERYPFEQRNRPAILLFLMTRVTWDIFSNARRKPLKLASALHFVLYVFDDHQYVHLHLTDNHYLETWYMQLYLSSESLSNVCLG